MSTSHSTTASLYDYPANLSTTHTDLSGTPLTQIAGDFLLGALMGMYMGMGFLVIPALLASNVVQVRGYS